MKFKNYINETKTQKLPLTKEEKNLIKDLKIYKEKYKLDRTQSNYRYNKDIFSSAFKEKQNLKELKKLIDRL